MNRMKPKFVLINPWIYDFSALNLWSRPLGLLKTAEYLSQFDVDLHLIDCTDGINVKRKYGTGKFSREIVKKPEPLREVPRNYARYGISVDFFTEKFKACLPCDLILMTSIMSYWYPGVQEAIEIVKKHSPGVPVILGGIYATLFHKHAIENSGADYVFSGHIADNCNASNRSPFGTERFMRDTYSGRSLDAVIRNFGINLARKRDTRPYYKLELYTPYPFAPLLTSMGCPNRCSYCASSLLFNGFAQRDPLDVLWEISELYKAGVKDFAFYDDALLANADSHLKVILKKIKALKMTVRFHCPNGIHARFIDDDLALLMKESGFTTLRLSLETTNAERQTKTGAKVTSDSLQSAVGSLKKYGFKKENIGVYLMYGLPGQSLQEVRDSVNFVKSLDVRINLTEFSPIPKTDCWNDLKNRGIISDDIDPLLTNNSVFSLFFSGYGLERIQGLKIYVKHHNAQK